MENLGTNLDSYPVLILHLAKSWIRIHLEKLIQNEGEELSFHQCCGSVTFWYGSVYADPYL